MKRLIGLFAVLLAGNLYAAESFLSPAEVATLKPHPDVEGVRRHITPGADPSKYDKLIVGGVTFYFSENSKTKDIDADEMKQISDAMKSAMVSAAADQAEVVLTPGPSAALVNVAITEIDMQNKKRGLLGYTPVGFVVSSTANLAGLRIQLKDAKIEGEVVDSVTGDVVSVFRIDAIANLDEKKGLSWEDLRLNLQESLTKGLAVVRKK